MDGMGNIDPLVIHGAILTLAAVAAFTDVRWGLIPNWLTLPPLVLAPFTHGVIVGTRGLLSSVLGLLVCSLVPLLVFYRGGMAGGDVKLFAALGAVSGLYLGLELQFLALVCAAIYAIGHLAWNGRLLNSLGNSLFLGLNPILPRKWRRTLSPELMHRIRLGAAILLGSARNKGRLALRGSRAQARGANPEQAAEAAGVGKQKTARAAFGQLLRLRDVAGWERVWRELLDTERQSRTGTSLGPDHFFRLALRWRVAPARRGAVGGRR